VLPAVPLACTALALAFRKPIGRRPAADPQSAADTAGDTTAVVGDPGGR